MFYLKENLNDLEKQKAPVWLFDVERSLIIWANKLGISFWNEETLFDLVDRRLNRKISDLDTIEATKEILEEKADEALASEDLSITLSQNENEIIREFGFYPADEKVDMLCKCLLVELEGGRRGVLLIGISENEHQNKGDSFLGDYQLDDKNIFEAVYNLLHQELGVFDMEGNLLFANQALSDNFDILLVKNGKKDISNLFDIIGNQDKALSIIKRTKEHLSINLGMRIVSKFGQRFHRIKSQLIEFNGNNYILISFEDQDDRRGLERGLIEVNSKLNDILSHACDFSWSSNQDDIINDISYNFYEITKLSKSDVLGKSWFDIFDKLHSDYDKQILVNLLSQKQKWRSDKISIFFNEGSDKINKDLYLSATALWDDDGNFKGYLGSGVFYDIDSQSVSGPRMDDMPEFNALTDVDNNADDEELASHKEMQLVSKSQKEDRLSSNIDQISEHVQFNEFDKTDESSNIESAKDFAGNLDEKDKSTFKSLGSSIKYKVDSDTEKADVIELDDQIDASVEVIVGEVEDDKSEAIQNQPKSSSQITGDDSKFHDEKPLDEKAAENVISKVDITQNSNKSNDELSNELVEKPKDLKNISNNDDDFILYITHRHYKESKFAVLLHRNFEILDCNNALVELIGFENIDEVIAKKNLMSLFPNEKMRLFNLQSEIENWKNTKTDNSSDQYNFKLIYNLNDGETITLNSTARQVIWNNEKIIYMSFSKLDEDLINVGNASSDTSDKQDYAIKSEQDIALSSMDNLSEFDKSNISKFPNKYEDNVVNFQHIMDEVGEGILIFEQDGKIIQSNKSTENLLNYGDKVINLNLFDILPEDTNKQLSNIITSISSGQKEGQFDNSFELCLCGPNLNDNGDERGEKDLIFTITRSNDVKGNLSAVIQDISKWKKAEKELINARVNAESESHKKSDMLARISHEIRTPLNSILGFSEVMTSEQYGPMVNDRYKEYVSDIKSSSELLLSLINNLLDLNKVEKGKFELNFVSVSIKLLVRKIYSMVKIEAAERKLLVRINIEDELPEIVADDISMKQIILNLLSNSIKYTKVGGQIIISGRKTQEGEIKISVQDTGIGMSEDELEIAMEPYRRIEEHKHSSIKGTGLGLPLTKALVEANRASFSIKSEKDNGTIATVTFPTNRVLEY